ncbi:TPA: SGNH/GDSL hydrolase family protein, partial [Raoultella ornithinolytica]
MSNRYNTGNSRPSNSMKDLNDNALAYDDFMLSEEGTFVDRLGNQVPTLKGLSEIMSQAGESVVEKTRQNLIPLSKQYQTLAAAQADIANIPEGSTTYYRSPDDSALAVEVINNAGTLVATGRKMPSYSSLRGANILFDAFNEYSSTLLTFANWDWYKGAIPTFSTSDSNLPLPTPVIQLSGVTSFDKYYDVS